MTNYTDKEALFATSLPEEDYELPGGAVVRIRSLSRQQVHHIASLERDESLAERFTLSYGLVQPKLTPNEAQRWMETAQPLVLTGVGRAIMRLSGLSPEEATDKATFPEDGTDGSGVQDIPGS